MGALAIVIWLLAREDGGLAVGSPRAAPSVALSAPQARGEEGSSDAVLPATGDATADAASEPRLLDVGGAQGARVRGRLVDADGTPRPGIRLALVDTGDGSADELAFLSAPRILARDGVPSDAAGTFELEARGPANRFYLCLQRLDGLTQWVREVGVLPRVTIDLGDIVLRAPERLAGFVHDTAGRPIAGAEVLCADGPSFLQAWIGCTSAPIAAALWQHVIPDEAWIQSFVALMPGAVRTQTDAGGAFAVELLLADRSQLFVAARAAGMTVETNVPDWAGTNDPSSANLVLRPAPGRLAGHVRSATGRAIPPGTAVTARAEAPGDGGDYGRAALVAPDGAFHVEGLLAGPHVLQLQAPGRTPSVEVSVEAGASDVELELPEPFVLTVSARDGHGAPLTRFDVLLADEPTTIVRPALVWRRLHVDAAVGGVLRLDELRSDDVSLQIVADGMAGLPARLRFGRSDVTHAWDETLRPLRTVRGVVRDRSSGEPVPGARLTATMPRGPEFPGGVAFTVADGTFTLPALPVVAFTLRVDAQGFVSQSVDVRSDATDLVVELERSTLVHVRLGPHLRDAIRAGSLEVADDESDVSVTPLPDGKPEHYTLRPGGLLLNLAPGRYRIELLEGAGNTQPVEFSAVAGELVVVDV